VRATIRRFACVMLVWVAIAGAVAVASGPHRIIDLRKRSEATEYEIGLCARPSPDATLGLPGHAFVSFSSKPTGQPRRYLAVGHTTRAGLGRVLLSYIRPLGPVEGHLAEELYTAVTEKCLLAKLDREAFDRALVFTQDPLSKLGLVNSSDEVRLAYALGAQDCVTFMTAVARAIGGVKIPPRLETDLPL